MRKRCHPDRSEAQWRDLLFFFPTTHLQTPKGPG
jgi:hypothetical protein